MAQKYGIYYTQFISGVSAQILRLLIFAFKTNY